MYIDGKNLPVFRASLHNHSTSSDGTFTIPQLATHYRDAGYDVFSISDHDVSNDITGIEIPGITILSGVELHPLGPRGILWHILALGVPGDFKAKGYSSGSEAVKAAKDVGALVYCAHPAWCGLHTEEILELGTIDGIEIFNAGARLCKRATSDEIWDELLQAENRPCRALGVDDCHDWTAFALGWTMIAAENRSPEAIYDALRNGRFYATEGPEFHSIEFKGGHFRATFSPAETAVLVSNFAQGYCAASPGFPMIGCKGKTITEIDVDVSAFSKGSYIRCQISSPDGYQAWTQPYFI